MKFNCIILKADNIKDAYYILSYNKTKYNIPELRVHFWTTDNSRMIENNYYSVINGYSIKSNIRKDNFLFTIKNYKYNKLLKNINKDNKFLKDTTIYSFNKQYQQLIPLSKQTFKLNKLKSNYEYYITIDIKIKDNSYVYYLCVNNDIIGKTYSNLKNNKNDFVLLKKNIDISQEYPYEDLYKTDNVNIPRIFNINTANKEKISYLLDDNLRWIFYKNNDDINKSRFYNKVLNKYITEKEIKEYIILNLLSSDKDLANNISENMFYSDTNYEINYDIISTQYRGNIYNKLESGKYYRIGNKGLNKLLADEKLYLYYDYRSDNKYLASDYTNPLFDNKYNSDPSIWLCVKNTDQTYSFICNSDNKTVLKSYTDNVSKFYISHNSDYYYNMFYSTLLNNKYLSLNTPISDDDEFILENNENTIHKLDNKQILIQNECIKYIDKINDSNSLFNDDLNYYLLPKDFDIITSNEHLNKTNSTYTTLGHYLQQNSNLYDILETVAIENLYKDVIVNQDYNKHSASSTWNNDPIGISHGRGRLNSIQGWSPKTKTRNEWYQIDLSSEQRIIGIVTQGRADGYENQYIKSYKVKVSIDGNIWTDVDNGRIFTGNNEKTIEDPDFEVRTKFTNPINSRYVRVYPVTYNSYPTMRIGVIIGESKFKNIPTIDTYKKIIINSDKFTTQLDIKENNNFSFNMYLDLHEKIESDTLMCPPPEIVDEVKYSDNIYKYEGDKDLPDYLYMKQKTKNLKNSAKFVSDINTISSIETLKNDYDKNIVKYGIKNNDNKKRELINNSNAANVNTILNTEIDEETQTNASIDNCLNHHKLINISINDTFELQLSIYIEGEERTLATPSVSINNIIKEDNNNIVVSIDENKFLNVYLNNILVIDANIFNVLHENSKNYYVKNIILNNSDKINNIYCWKHETLKDCAIWNTKTIKINSENGIKCMSNKNKNIYLDFVLEYYSKGIYYIKDNNNNYLCISNEAGNYPDYNFDLNNIELLDCYIEWVSQEQFEKIKNNNIKRLLWNIYEVDNNSQKYLHIDNKNLEPYDFNKFSINFEELKDITDKKLWSDKDYDNNLMLQIDDISYLKGYNINEERHSQVKLQPKSNGSIIDYTWFDTPLFNNTFSYKLDNDKRRFEANRKDIENIIQRSLKEKDLLTIRQKNKEADVELNIIKQSYNSDTDEKPDDIIHGYWKYWKQIKDWERFDNSVIVKSDPSTFDISHNHVCIGINEDKQTAYCRPQGLVSESDRISGFDFKWDHSSYNTEDQYINGAYKCFNNNLGPGLDYDDNKIGLQGILFGEGNCENYNNQSIYDLENMYIEQCDSKNILNLSDLSNNDAIKQIECSIKNANGPTDINNNICSLDSDCPEDYTCAKKNSIEGYCVKECNSESASSPDCPIETPSCGYYHPFDEDKLVCNVDVNKVKATPTMTGGSTNIQNYNTTLQAVYTSLSFDFKNNSELLFDRTVNNDLYYYIGQETYVDNLEDIDMNKYLDTDILCQIVDANTTPSIKTSLPEKELKTFVLTNTFNTYDGYLIEETSSGKLIYKYINYLLI